MVETTNSEKKFCVRFKDCSGLDFKIYKPKFPNKLERKRFHFCANYVEQLSRGCSPTSVAKRKDFLTFQRFSKGLKLNAMPEGYHGFSEKRKKETVKNLVAELVDELATAMSHEPVQVDYPDDNEVDAGSTRQFDATVREDVGMQVNNPAQIQVDGVQAAAPNPDFGNTMSNDASLQNDGVQAAAPNPDFGNAVSNESSLQNVAWDQSDNPQGQPSSRPPVSLEEIVFIFNDLMLRASRFPGILPKFEWSEEAFRSFVQHLECLEGAFMDSSSLNFRSRQEEVYERLPDFSVYEDVNSLSTMEGFEDEIWSHLSTSSGRPEVPGTSSNVFLG